MPCARGQSGPWRKRTNSYVIILLISNLTVHDSRGSVLLDHEQDIQRRQQNDEYEGSEEEVFGLDDGEDEEEEDDMSDLGDVGGEQEDSEEDIDSKSSLPPSCWNDLRTRRNNTNQICLIGHLNRGVMGKD